MPLSPPSQRLFERTWRASCPIRPRHSRLRRWGCLALLVVLTGLIVAYAWVTDTERVRAQAEGYLSRLVGGRAQVEHATLSLFEGLRLEGVTIRTPQESGIPDPLDATLFTARSVHIDYNPLQLLAGRLTATRVVAVDPHVRVTENLDDESWNFQRLRRQRRGDGKFHAPDELPEILLRNAQVDYSRLSDETLTPRGSVGIEAQLTPMLSEVGRRPEEGAYRFAVQTRGLSSDADDAGPRASGVLDLHRGELDARLEDVDFAALLDVLPRAAAEWWRRHGITGHLDVPQIRLNWDQPVRVATPEGMETLPRFRVVVKLDDATVQGLPEEWLPPEEVWVRRALVARLEKLQTFLSPAETDLGIRGVVKPYVANLTEAAIGAMQLHPVGLRDVEGTFIFTEGGVRINGLVGSLEGNRMRVDGIVDGYTKDAGLSLAVQNAEAALTVPRQMHFLTSLPRQVRELHNRFSPQGRARMRLELHRPATTAGGPPVRPLVTGFVEVLDGTFSLDRFPYPVHNARGRILLRYDRTTGYDQLILEDLRGNGQPGSLNADAALAINGLVAPLNSVAGFDITVTGRNVRNEPDLLAALPPEARQTVDQFNPALHGKGSSFNGGDPPAVKFGGDFIAHVMRPAGRDQKWDFRVDLFLDDINGVFAGFPYPLVGATGEVNIFPDHVRIVRTTMRRPTPGTDALASLDLRGRIDWGKRPGDSDDLARRTLRVDLSVVGDDLPTDAALWNSLPADAAAQLKSLGLGGTADLAARVFTNKEDELAWDVTLDVRNGRFWPEVGTFSLSDIAGRVRVMPDRVVLDKVTGRRGEGSVSISGTLGLGEDGQTNARILASRLTLDPGVYNLLPATARDAWDWLQPSGATDVEATYRGPTALLWGGEATPAPPTALTGNVTAEEMLARAEPQYAVTLRPQGISVLPRAFPYPMQNVRGTIHVEPGNVVLEGVTAEHAVIAADTILTDLSATTMPAELAPAQLSISGMGEFGAGPGGADVYRLAPSVRDMPIDESLLTALPAGLADTLRSLSATGRISADFDVLRITVPNPEPAAEVALASDSPAAVLPPDVAFDVTLGMRDVLIDVGMELGEIAGTLDLAGTYEKGRLHELSGRFLGESFTVSGRQGNGLSGTIHLPPGGQTLRIDDIAAQVASGQLGGDVALTFGDKEVDPTRYAVSFLIRDADVRRLVGAQNGKAADFGGNLTARLDLDGTLGHTDSRRGRGEVLVRGKKLYELPLVLGLLQVTNLALPIAEPFREATAAFAVDGPRIVFDQISLRAAEMQMSGQGTLNFETQKVDLTFTTSNHGWAQIPLLGDIVGLARNELLRINVRGTLEEPEVSGSTLPTITSTIDEVFRGE